MNKYNHKKLEQKWKKEWEKKNLYKTETKKNKPKYYILDMFPYPSGAGLHVGHPKGYIATDIFARMKTMQGFNVLHPMGWDAFGLPAENFAIKNKVHPKISTEKNIATFKSQLDKLGFSYDWDREINTTDPEFYKWTQWIFLKMFEKGLAYESHEPIIWCPSCQTGLANEDLEDGKCERCGSEVERKPMRQWVLKITDYADRMLDDLEKLPDWDDSIREMQKNWIGRSEGAEIQFSILNFKFSINVFTTRPDTLFGATYMVLAPEHSLISNLKSKISNLKEVEDYIKKAQKKSDLERTDLAKEKTGIEIKGIKAINPVNGQEIPIFVADYVLAGYGTGAIMAVPAHDQRDWEFANSYNMKHATRNNDKAIKIVPVVTFSKTEVKFEKKGNDIIGYTEDLLYSESEISDMIKDESLPGEGVAINSGFLDGLKTAEAKKKMIEWLEKNKAGKKAVNYKLNDWVFSRQRYWGEPIPIIHCDNCGAVAVPEKDLPVKLPEVEHYEPSGTGESPLANIAEWVNVKCPRCGMPGKRETNTMPQWAGSSWYYLRYIDPHNNGALVDKTEEKYWSPVDFYVGGAEHATRHLIYARFWHKFLFDIGAVNYEEPFARLQHVGLIMAEDGRKMSKRWNNVINPDDVVEEYGADAMRVYEMFMGPFSQPCAWNTNGLAGARKFLDKVYSISRNVERVTHNDNKELSALLHKTIKKVGEDIEGFKFNTAISAMMILVNKIGEEKVFNKNNFEMFLKILAPFAPFLCEEIWSEFGNKESIFKETWPEYDRDLIKDEVIELVLQVNGKVRGRIEVEAGINEEDAKKIALENEKIKKWTKDKKIIKVIFVKGRLINIVVE